MKKDEARESYVEALISEGNSFVVYENGDILIADSPRIPRGEAKPVGTGCVVQVCRPGRPASEDDLVTVDDGGHFFGNERQRDGSCEYRRYRCDNGTLVPIP